VHERLKGVGHLHRELTGRHEHQRARPTRDPTGPVGEQPSEHGQAERQGLSGAGLATAKDVAAGERVGDGRVLDRERRGDAVAGEPLDEPLGQAEGGETVVLGHRHRVGRDRRAGRRGPGVGFEALALRVDERLTVCRPLTIAARGSVVTVEAARPVIPLEPGRTRGSTVAVEATRTGRTVIAVEATRTSQAVVPLEPRSPVVAGGSVITGRTAVTGRAVVPVEAARPVIPLEPSRTVITSGTVITGRTRGAVVPLEPSGTVITRRTGRAVVAVETPWPVVPLEARRAVVAVETPWPVVPLEARRAVVAVETARAVITLEARRAVVAVETARAVITLEARRTCGVAIPVDPGRACRAVIPLEPGRTVIALKPSRAIGAVEAGRTLGAIVADEPGRTARALVALDTCGALVAGAGGIPGGGSVARTGAGDVPRGALGARRLALGGGLSAVRLLGAGLGGSLLGGGPAGLLGRARTFRGGHDVDQLLPVTRVDASRATAKVTG